MLSFLLLTQVLVEFHTYKKVDCPPQAMGFWICDLGEKGSQNPTTGSQCVSLCWDLSASSTWQSLFLSFFFFSFFFFLMSTQQLGTASWNLFFVSPWSDDEFMGLLKKNKARTSGCWILSFVPQIRQKAYFSFKHTELSPDQSQSPWNSDKW